jgi:25S rRNA (adenine2142-N1)-methyltransferase
MTSEITAPPETESSAGRMLRLAQSILVPGGYLFLAVRLSLHLAYVTLTLLQLPLPCVANSRYINLVHLNALMHTIGFSELKAKWREGGKMIYWLYQKQASTQEFSNNFSKKVTFRTGNRNNFCILL